MSLSSYNLLEMGINTSSIAALAITVYIMLFLQGDFDITSSSLSQIKLETVFLNFSAQVAVSAIILALSGSKLRISPILNRSFLKVSPLYYI